MPHQNPQQSLPSKGDKDTPYVEPQSADLPLAVATVQAEEALGDAGRRKEYREALKRAGIDMDFLVENLKNIATAGEKDSDKIKAVQVLLKSLGVDKSVAKDEEEGGGGSWEEALMEDKEEVASKDYEVDEPEVPEHARKKREDEDAMGRSIYG